MWFSHLCWQCCCSCSPPVFLILQHNRLTQDQPFSLQSTNFSCLLAGLHLCSSPLAQPPLVILLALQTPPDLVCHIVSLLLTLKCQFASLGGREVVCHPHKNMFTDFVHSSSVVSHIWKELPANLHMLLVSENCSSSALVREVLRPSIGHVHLSSSCLSFCLSCNFCSVFGQLQVL